MDIKFFWKASLPFVSEKIASKSKIYFTENGKLENN